jgi:translation elongation factor EF-Tu-like GTPase
VFGGWSSCVIPTIRANVTLLSRENGGRVTMPMLASGKYMPHIVVQSPDVRTEKAVNGNVIVDDYLGVRFVSAANEPLPDQSVECDMEMMYHLTVDYDLVREGASFTVREGGRVIGFGLVTRRSA